MYHSRSDPIINFPVLKKNPYPLSYHSESYMNDLRIKTLSPGIFEWVDLLSMI